MEYICPPSLSLSLSLSSALLTDPRASERASFKHYSPSHSTVIIFRLLAALDPSSELHGIKLRFLSCVTLPRREKAWMNFTIHQTFPFLLVWWGPKARRVHGTAQTPRPQAVSCLFFNVLFILHTKRKHFLIKSERLALHDIQETQVFVHVLCFYQPGNLVDALKTFRGIQRG